LKIVALLFLAAMALAGCAPRDLSTPELYRTWCARCHGKEGRGDARYLKRYPYLDLRASPMVLRGDRAAVRQRIAEGEGPMPGFSHRLSPPEIERLVDFTFQLGHTRN
jgi:mono/diheme cytochrome c family protein